MSWLQLKWEMIPPHPLHCLLLISNNAGDVKEDISSLACTNYISTIAAINPDLHLLPLEGLKAINSQQYYSDYWLLFIWDELTIIRLRPGECSGKDCGLWLLQIHKVYHISAIKWLCHASHPGCVTGQNYNSQPDFITDVHCFGHPNIEGIFQ